jgi:hypothetical protein
MGKIRRINPNIKKSVGKAAKDLERATDILNDKVGKTSEETSGAVGSVRIIVDGETPYLEVLSKKGWVRSDNSSASGFSFKK